MIKPLPDFSESDAEDLALIEKAQDLTIRMAALNAAAIMYTGRFASSGKTTIELAEVFEKYLRGKNEQAVDKI